MKKNLVILILSLICFNQSYCQNKTELYKFVVENKFIIDSITGFYAGGEFEFNYKRIYIADSTFNEVGLFTGTEQDRTLFKIKNRKWYVKYKKKWMLLYSPTKTKANILPKIIIGGKVFDLVNVGMNKIDNIECVIYKRVLAERNVNVSGDTNYWFNPQLGIIKIETSEVNLIREDIKTGHL